MLPLTSGELHNLSRAERKRERARERRWKKSAESQEAVKVKLINFWKRKIRKVNPSPQIGDEANLAVYSEQTQSECERERRKKKQKVALVALMTVIESNCHNNSNRRLRETTKKVREVLWACTNLAAMPLHHLRVAIDWTQDSEWLTSTRNEAAKRCNHCE